MKLHALTALTALLSLTSCYMYPPPGGPRPPAYGPRGYPLDRGPGGERRYGAEQPPGPRDTRFLDPYGEDVAPSAPSPRQIPREDVVDIEPPRPELPPTPEEPLFSTKKPDTGVRAPEPLVITPPETSKPKTPEVTVKKPEPPPAPKPPTTTSGLPTASKSKPGFVKSPFDPLGRDIDVSDFRSGQKARCPYTQKIFVVP